MDEPKSLDSLFKEKIFRIPDYQSLAFAHFFVPFELTRAIFLVKGGVE